MTSKIKEKRVSNLAVISRKRRIVWLYLGCMTWLRFLHLVTLMTNKVFLSSYNASRVTICQNSIEILGYSIVLLSSNYI